MHDAFSTHNMTTVVELELCYVFICTADRTKQQLRFGEIHSFMHIAGIHRITHVHISMIVVRLHPYLSVSFIHIECSEIKLVFDLRHSIYLDHH